MAKKTQTSARRNNTQVGSQVVNFYNHGNVNVDSRHGCTTSAKANYTFCTISNLSQVVRPFTLKDQIEDGHPILGKVSLKDVEPAVIKVATTAAKSHPTVSAASKSSHWGYIAMGIALLVGVAAVKYCNN